MDQENPNVWSKVTCGSKSCGHSFCGKCGQAPHNNQPGEVNQTCQEYARWKEENAAGDQGLADLMKEKDWKKCPKCQSAVEKQAGCKYMTCRCKCKFCYICGRELKHREQHYSHFSNGPFGNTCHGNKKDSKGFTALFPGEVTGQKGFTPPPKRKKKKKKKKAGWLF